MPTCHCYTHTCLSISTPPRPPTHRSFADCMLGGAIPVATSASLLRLLPMGDLVDWARLVPVIPWTPEQGPFLKALQQYHDTQVDVVLWVACAGRMCVRDATCVDFGDEYMCTVVHSVYLIHVITSHTCCSLQNNSPSGFGCLAASVEGAVQCAPPTAVQPQPSA